MGEVTTADVVVVGGGLAGLAAAATAAGDGRRVVLLDGHPFGGRARTEERNGYVFNRGPRALYLGGAGRSILQQFGIDPTGGPPLLKGSMGLLDGSLHLLPQGPGSLVRTDLLGVKAKLKLGALLGRMQKIDATALTGMTLNGWLADSGLPPAAADLVRMLIRVATYTNAADQMSADVAVQQGQLALGPGVRYIDGGWQTLVDGLVQVARTAGAELRTGVNVRGIDHGADSNAAITNGASPGVGDGGGVRVRTDDGDITAGSVIVAAGTPAACAAVLGHRPAAWDRLGPEVGAACLELGLRRPPAHRVVIGIDQPLYCSTHCPPARLAPEGGAVVQVLRYQPPDSTTTADQDRAELRAAARLAGITDDDIVEERFLRRMVVTGGFPTPATGGLPGRPSIEVEGRPGVFVAGDWVGPTGFLVDAALSSALAAASAAAVRSTRMAVA